MNKYNKLCMTLKCGIIGLPNVGKSTLFNALTASNIAQAANYPFCTIEPNSAIVSVPDERLERLMTIADSKKIIPAYIEFVDIAGLVKGASKGEGLGNKFLSHIREVDAIIHVLRCFIDPDITHVHNNVDPIYDAEIIETELIIADLESVERRANAIEKRAKSGDQALRDELTFLNIARDALSRGDSIRNLHIAQNLSHMQLLSAKPILYVCNVLERDANIGNSFTNIVANKAEKESANYVIISSKIEAEIANLQNIEEKIEFLASLGIKEASLSKIIKAAYTLLGLRSFFTIGPQEAHAWTFIAGENAQQAAAIIHSDFAKGFIRAEIIAYNDYVQYGGETRAKEAGKMRLEGKDYKVMDGDIVHFRFNI
jgi:GTP-binding protein YchF